MNQRWHPASAWGLLITVIATVAATVWLPLMDQAQLSRDRIASLEQRVTRIQALESTQLQVNDELAQLRYSIGFENSNQFVVAKSPTLGAAELQRRIQDIIVANNASQISSQPLNPAATVDFYKLVVNVSFSGNINSLLDVLYALEFGQPRIFIDQLLISGNSVRRNRTHARQKAQSRLTPTGRHDLSIRLMASAYMQLGECSDAKTALK